jgi:hypothetical protein
MYDDNQYPARIWGLEKFNKTLRRVKLVWM